MAAAFTFARTVIIKNDQTRVYRQSKRKRFCKHAATCFKIGTLVGVAGLATVTVLTYLSYRNFATLVDQQIAGGYLRSHAGLYAAPRIIEKGARLSRAQLSADLERAGYAPESASNIWNGSFQTNEQGIRISPRQGTETYHWIDVSFDNDYVTNLVTDDSSALSSYALEPELLTADAALKTGSAQNLTYQEIPPVMVQAILSIEDRRFFEHNGLDIWGIGRAFLRWATSGSVKFRQGGSTITQQLVKNTYLTPEKTLRRKFHEAMIALALEQRLSKQDIFALYCNEVYLGQRGGVGVRGISQAARIFFGKELKDLSLAEAATIAGMIQSPARYAPDRHPDAARARRDTVIAAMARDKAVDLDAGQREAAQPINVAAFEGRSNGLAPYYIDAVNRQLDDVQRRSEPDAEQSVRVLTTIDPDLQMAAENALHHQLEALDSSNKSPEQPQGAMVALDVRTGQVLAMVGGRNYAESQLNRATDARRQPGSVFKPFVYATAMEVGISPLSTARDAPQTFQYDHANYSPANYGSAYSMRDVLFREGLVRSLNVVTVDLAVRAGLANVAATAARFGLPRPDAYPSLALGTSEATPLQMAAAYAAFANGGTVFEPTFVSSVVDNNSGETIVSGSPASQQVIRPTTAYMITDMLADVTKRGTGRRANGHFQHVAIAGKTGTSRDGWFVGYTTNLVCAVWIGFDDNRQLGLTGAEAALPAWIDFMENALAVRPSLGGAAFEKPSGITTVKIDPETGQRAGPNCPGSLTVSVASQFDPVMECLKHQPETEYLAEAVDVAAEYPVETPPTADSELVGPARSEPLNEASAVATPEVANTHHDNEPPPAVRPKLGSQPTRVEMSPSGRAILISAPALAREPGITNAVKGLP